MKHLLLITALALLACSGEPPTAPLEPSSYNPHRLSTPSVEAADDTPGHVCMTFGYGFCGICMANKYAKRDSVCAPPPWGWGSYNPMPTMWGGPGSNQK